MFLASHPTVFHIYWIPAPIFAVAMLATFAGLAGLLLWVCNGPSLCRDCVPESGRRR